MLPFALPVHDSVPTKPILLWPAGVPDGWTHAVAEESVHDQGGNFQIVRNVSVPTIQMFMAPHPYPHAPTVIVFPGGGYAVEAIEHEGWEIATRLNKAGMNAAVVKYRLPAPGDSPLNKAPLQDAQRAIRFVRSEAIAWGLDANRIGILGFSAGGHLAAAASNTAEATYPAKDPEDGQSFRPDFTILIYPAYLVPDHRPDKLSGVEVTKNAPPAFITQTMDDPFIGSAFAYAEGCQKAGVQAELHLFPKGGHGYGIRSKEPGITTWPDLLTTWLRRYFP